MRTRIPTLLAIFAIIGMAVADYPISSSHLVNSASIEGSGIIFQEERNMSYQEDQKISGTGFFSSYRYLLMTDAPNDPTGKGVEAKKEFHGSGTIDSDSKTYGNFDDITWRDLYEDFEALGVFPDEFEETTNSTLGIKEDNKMTYSPTAFPAGSRYYAVHPITFNSLLADKAWVKNRGGLVSTGGGTSMNHAVEDAHGLDMALDVQADNIQSTVLVPLEVTNMKVEEDVVDGKAHFGVLQLPENELTAKELHDPITYLDEDYVGTYHLKKNMNVTSTYPSSVLYDDWLPCCFGGYMTMPTYYQRGTYGFGSNVKGVFDCTCFKVPATAEWPRIY